jgi:hypothetical protein
VRALTVRQPWAWAIVHGGKDVENRTRNLAGGYRGPVAIHAGLTDDDAAYDDDMIRQALSECDDGWLLAEEVGTLGAFVGVVDLDSVHHDSDHGRGHRCSPWAQSDLWHNVVTNPRPLPQPIPARGMLGLWTPTADVLEQLQAVAR